MLFELEANPPFLSLVTNWILGLFRVLGSIELLLAFLLLLGPEGVMKIGGNFTKPYQLLTY